MINIDLKMNTIKNDVFDLGVYAKLIDMYLNKLNDEIDKLEKENSYYKSIVKTQKIGNNVNSAAFTENVNNDKDESKDSGIYTKKDIQCTYKNALCTDCFKTVEEMEAKFEKEMFSESKKYSNDNSSISSKINKKKIDISDSKSGKTLKDGSITGSNKSFSKSSESKKEKIMKLKRKFSIDQRHKSDKSGVVDKKK